MAGVRVRHRRRSMRAFLNSPGRKKRAHLLRPRSRRSSLGGWEAPRDGGGLTRPLAQAAACSHVLAVSGHAHPQLRSLAPDPQARSEPVLPSLPARPPPAYFFLIPQVSALTTLPPGSLLGRPTITFQNRVHRPGSG